MSGWLVVSWLKDHWRSVLTGVLLLLCVCYYGQAHDEQRRAERAENALQLAQDAINEMQTRQRDVAALDSKYSGELADAKTTIDQLQRDVAAGHQRLRLNATCHATADTARATGVDDAASARLTDAAQRDYFTLRERIATISKQLNGLQAYVREQCLK